MTWLLTFTHRPSKAKQQRRRESLQDKLLLDKVQVLHLNKCNEALTLAYALKWLLLLREVEILRHFGKLNRLPLKCNLKEQDKQHNSEHKSKLRLELFSENWLHRKGLHKPKPSWEQDRA
jgi:hypothetical protein